MNMYTSEIFVPLPYLCRISNFTRVRYICYSSAGPVPEVLNMGDLL